MIIILTGYQRMCTSAVHDGNSCRMEVDSSLRELGGFKIDIVKCNIINIDDNFASDVIILMTVLHLSIGTVVVASRHGGRRISIR